MKPTKKHPDIEEFINLSLPGGRKREKCIEANICAWCGRPALRFRDGLSRREYRISGLCQLCQDKTFK